MAGNPNELWTDAELAAAVDAYVFLLGAERRGIRQRGEIAAKILLSGSLSTRNDASIRYRMRNISAVVREYGISTLSAYSPAERVGARVAEKIRRMLDEHSEFRLLLSSNGLLPLDSARSVNGAREEAAAKLRRLEAFISDLERQIFGRGHNNPPESLLAEGISSTDFVEAYRHIDSLRAEMSTDAPSLRGVEGDSNALMEFGLKMVTWAGRRLTKFADATLVVMAPALALKLTGLTPLLFDALAAVTRALLPH
jgi:hypothetical protein